MSYPHVTGSAALARARPPERLDGASVFSSDGAATRHDRARPDREGTFADPLGADGTALPFGQMRRGRDVCEYLLGFARSRCSQRWVDMRARAVGPASNRT